MPSLTVRGGTRWGVGGALEAEEEASGGSDVPAVVVRSTVSVLIDGTTCLAGEEVIPLDTCRSTERDVDLELATEGEQVLGVSGSAAAGGEEGREAGAAERSDVRVAVEDESETDRSRARENTGGTAERGLPANLEPTHSSEGEHELNVRFAGTGSVLPERGAREVNPTGADRQVDTRQRRREGGDGRGQMHPHRAAETADGRGRRRLAGGEPGVEGVVEEKKKKQRKKSRLHASTPVLPRPRGGCGYG